MNANILLFLLMIFCLDLTSGWRRRSPPPCYPVHCAWSQWSAWSSCPSMCGTTVQYSRTRTRYIATHASCGGSICTGPSTETEPCPQNDCHGHGTPLSLGCLCDDGYWGLCCESAGQEPDPCSNNVEIDEEIRSTAHQTNRSLQYSYLLCDDNMPYQWYRFVSGAGGQLATDENIPTEYTCGTHIPIYMTGTHPESDDIEDRTVCTVFNGNQCADSWSIEVKKCDGFYVYKLLRVDVCASAYCAGSGKRCPYGENSPTGFTPGCSSMYPKIQKPKLTNEIVKHDKYRKKPVFHCSFESELDGTRKDMFDIDWYVDDVHVWTDSLTETDYNGGKLSSTLAEFRFPKRHGKDCTYEDGLYHLGQTLQCSVTSRFENGNVASPVKYSDHYYAGIRANDSVVYLDENGDDPQSVYLYTNVYVECDDNNSRCTVSAWLKSDLKDDIKHCRVDFHSGEEIGLIKRFPIVYHPDQQHSGKEETFILEFDTFFIYNPVYYSCFSPPSITIQRRDKPSATCLAWGDPHYVTFDNKKYDFYGVGDYVMMKMKNGVVNLNFEVHVRLRRCNSGSPSNPSCNCAVAVREGTSVAIIDVCVGPEKPPDIYVHRDPKNCDAAFQVTISQDGTEVRVNTPSGQRVRATLFKSHMDINIDVNGAVFEKAEGLCGNVNRDASDDLHYWKDSQWTGDSCNTHLYPYSSCLPLEFPKSYRLDHGASLFYPSNWPVTNVLAPDYPRCQCIKNPNNTNSTTVCEGTGSPMGGFGDGKSVTSCDDVYRRRRSLDDSYNDDDEYDPYKYEVEDNNDEFYTKGFTWPTPSGITEEEAVRECNRVLNQSNVMNTCGELSTINDLVTSTLDSCVFDILVMDDFTFLENIRSTVESACLFEFYSNVTLWEENDDGELAPPVSIVNAVCPNHCSGHGECGMDGNCTCDDGYTGIDCSIEIGVPPTVRKVLSGDVCDVKTRPCERVSIHATGLLNSEDLTCISRDLEYSKASMSWKETGRVSKTQAEFFTAYMVYCYLPITGIHRRSLPDPEATSMYKAFGVSLSNDGEIESNQAFLMIYDSLCVNCTSTGDCYQKENTCFIDGKCYSANAVNSDDECSSCVPDVSINSWSPLTSDACEPELQTENINGVQGVKGWFIPVVVVASVFGLALGAVVLYCVVKRLKTHTKKDTTVSPDRERKKLNMTELK